MLLVPVMKMDPPPVDFTRAPLENSIPAPADAVPVMVILPAFVVMADEIVTPALGVPVSPIPKIETPPVPSVVIEPPLSWIPENVPLTPPVDDKETAV